MIIMKEKMFSILISTKNRCNDLIFTLNKLQDLLIREDVECVVYDDGSDDGTFNYIQNNYPTIVLKRNELSKGYLYCRNEMLSQTEAMYAISLDDDAHFLTNNPLERVQSYFESNPHCGLIAFRIFWGLMEPANTVFFEFPQRVQSFVGCAHVWRMKAWHNIPNYPEWFVFYGEEDFGSFQLFKQDLEVHYLPEIVVNHRVDLKLRKNSSDYYIRLRSSLRSGWFLFFLFYPKRIIPRKIVYSIWMQLQLKVFKGDVKVLQVIGLALFDLFLAIPRIIQNSNRLTKTEFASFERLPAARIYWQPEK
jgi:glycosyltransferase involved in cell wall biosynthesis